MAFAAFGLMACSGVGGEQELGESSQAATAEATVVFNGNFTTEVRGTLERGKRLRILYSADRAKCRSTYSGRPAWAVSAYYRWNGGEIRSVLVAGLRSDPTAPEPGIDLDRTGELEMWFQNTDRSGCNEFDSAFGQNYKFTVVASGREPGWLGKDRKSVV